MANVIRSQMEEELANTWKKDLNHLPVFKDLPRLAGRIIVEVSFEEPFFGGFLIPESPLMVVLTACRDSSPNLL